jgi:Integrase core domain
MVDTFDKFQPPNGGSYLAVGLDLFTRKIVGWAMRDHRRAERAIAALSMAIQRQKPPPGLINHSYRGRQYAAAGYRKVHDAGGHEPARPTTTNVPDGESVAAPDCRSSPFRTIRTSRLRGTYCFLGISRAPHIREGQ